MAAHVTRPVADNIVYDGKQNCVSRFVLGMKTAWRRLGDTTRLMSILVRL